MSSSNPAVISPEPHAIAVQRGSTTSDVAHHHVLADPLSALARVDAEPSRRRREQLRTAALRDWAATAPEAAAQWIAANLPAAEREAALATVIAAAAAHPAAAIQFVKTLERSDPSRAYVDGHTLIHALTSRGEFAAAAEFATAHTEWVNTAFSIWAQHQPEAAMRTALAHADASARSVALAGVIAGWAPDNPAALAEFSQQMPAGPERTAALGEALRHWVAQDPVAASAWIDRRPPGEELDAGAAAIATFQPLIAQRPQSALEWAESIVDPALRAHTREVVLNASTP